MVDGYFPDLQTYRMSMWLQALPLPFLNGWCTLSHLTREGLCCRDQNDNIIFLVTWETSILHNDVSSFWLLSLISDWVVFLWECWRFWNFIHKILELKAAISSTARIIKTGVTHRNQIVEVPKLACILSIYVEQTYLSEDQIEKLTLHVMVEPSLVRSSHRVLNVYVY